MRAKGARAVAIVATVGNLLQGWDGGAIAGALLYIKPEYHLEDNPTLEGFVVASTLIGAVLSTAVAGPAADWLGRRTMLTVSAFIFSVSAIFMAFAPSVYWLVLGRGLVGCAIGLAATISPILIAESAPTEIRGQLSTFPQLMGSSGQFLAYIMGFAVSLTVSPDWRLMLGVLFAPALLYFVLCIFFLPESPRWLVSKGQMLAARQVLQNLRGKEDVGGELALLVEGLGVGVDGKLEEWLLQPADVHTEDSRTNEEDTPMTIIGPEDGVAWIATPMVENTGDHQLLSRCHSVDPSSMLDPMVTLVGSFQVPHDYLQDSFDDHGKHDNWDEESPQQTPRAANGHYRDDFTAGDMDESFQTPLLSRQTSNRSEKPRPVSRGNSVDLSNMWRPVSRGNSVDLNNIWRSSSNDVTSTLSRSVTGSGAFNESMNDVGIGGGWQLGWRYTGPEAGDPTEVGSLQRVYIFNNPVEHSSGMSVGGDGEPEPIQASVLVAPAVSMSMDVMTEDAVGPAMIHPADTATQGPAWKDFFVPGVRRALVVGIGLQVLQQFCGINAVLYFIPQILQQSGADVLLSSMGFSAESSSILASGVSTLMMIPCIIVAMRLMDRSGRRQLLLATLPLLGFALVLVVLTNTLLSPGLVQAAISFAGVTIYICAFVMGFGPIPNILCSEIFPTRVRGICIGICSAAMWLSNIIVTYSFPVLNSSLGLQGVFAIFFVISVVSWIFIFIKVPETKGMPLEVISEFFALSAVVSKKPAMGNEKEHSDDFSKV